MVMKEKIIKWFIVVVVLGIMFTPIIIEAFFSFPLSIIKYQDMSKKLEETYNYGFAMVYVAPKESEDTKTHAEEIKEIAEGLKTVSTSEPLSAYFMDYDKLSENDKKEIFGDSSEKTAYLYLVNNELLTTTLGRKSSTEVRNEMSMNSANEINPSLQIYKVPEDAASYKKLVKDKKKVTMTVFGKDTCFYCNQFKVVYNTVAREENVDIYYINSETYDSKEYDKIMDLGLKVPASCAKNNEETLLAPGYDTPLTLFTKNGKVIDCISGYSNKTQLITKLKTVGMIEDTEKE